MSDEIKEFTLPSGAVLGLNVAPYADAKALAQAILVEAKGISFGEDTDHLGLTKDIICSALSSKEIEKCALKCMSRCTYNGSRINNDTWEPVEARGDYVIALYRVIEENITPFLNGLLPDFQQMKGVILTLINTRKSKSTMTPSSSTSDYAKQGMHGQ